MLQFGAKPVGDRGIVSDEAVFGYWLQQRRGSMTTWADELAMYKQTMAKVLTPACAAWLEGGRAGLGGSSPALKPSDPLGPDDFQARS